MFSLRRAALVVVLLMTARTADASTIFMGQEYEVILAEGATWDQARAAAMALGSGWDLATIGSAAENTFVESILNTSRPDRSQFWIGATDRVTEGAFLWVDGSPFVFTDWWGGEPNDLGGEDFLAYDLRFGSWAWNDAAPNAFTLGLIRGFVAERTVPTQSSPEPVTLSLFGLGAVAAALAHRRRARR